MPTNTTVPIKAFKVAVRRLVVAACGLVVLVLTPYFLIAAGPLSSKQEHWVAFANYTGGTLGPVLSFFALCAALLSVFLQTKTLESKYREDADTEQQRRNLVYRLLHDEYAKRYTNVIRPPLMELRNSKDEAAQVMGLLNMEFRDDDLLVSHLVAQRFSDYYFLRDPELVSESIHVFVRIRDLRDLQASVRPAAHDKTNSVFPAVPGSRRFQDQLVETIDALDTAINTVLQRIKTLHPEALR